MKPPFIPSEEQSEFFRAGLDPSGPNLALCAVAGAGKTETLVQFTRLIPRPTRCVVLMFARANADDAAARMPYDVVATTFHSYANEAIKRSVGKLKRPNPRKCAAFVKSVVPSWNERKDWESDLLTLVSRAKSFGSGVLPDAPSLTDLRETFALDVPESRMALVEETLAWSASVRDELDFDDMLLHALRDDVSFDHADWVLVDEAQDTNAVQAALLSKILDARGERPCTSYAGFAEPHNDIDACTICGKRRDQHPRLILVGDPNQAIYAFRGAGASAYADLRDQFACRKLPLSVSRRCSQAVAAEARRVLAAPLVRAHSVPQRSAKAENFNLAHDDNIPF